MIGSETPALQALAASGSMAPLETAFPALTLSGQALLSTGCTPSRHGIVGNGWYDRTLAEVQFWKQPHGLIGAPTLAERLHEFHPGLRIAHLFWWFAMYAPVDISVTPRPMYPADGRKLPDIHTHPPELRSQLQSALGQFPLFQFWGPMAGLASTRWIAAAATRILSNDRPDLSLVYLPHLDYDFQRFGPEDQRSKRALAAVDQVVGELSAAARQVGARTLVVSEYGITRVHKAVHPNRILRASGLLSLRDELGTERLDCGASRAFAVADHQIAHVYVRDRKDVPALASLFRGVEGIAEVLYGDALRAAGMDHARSGDILLVAERESWFTYYWWLETDKAPDYARTVDIHRKPGYDPCELMFDPSLRFPRVKAMRRVLARKLGFRNLLDVIGLDPAVVRGSHGRRPDHLSEGAVIIAEGLPSLPLERGFVRATSFFEVVRELLR
jgi:predicted AlkP superfamily pyrophosphatase or phosphodiesterase